mgnify:CR=1 FL=1
MQMSGRSQAADQRVFRTSRAAEMIKGSIVRLEPSVEGAWGRLDHPQVLYLVFQWLPVLFA